MIRTSKAITTTPQADRPERKIPMNEKHVTLTLTEKEIKMLYRACACRSSYFYEKAAKSEDLSGIDRDVAAKYRDLGRAILDQSGVKM